MRYIVESMNEDGTWIPGFAGNPDKTASEQSTFETVENAFKKLHMLNKHLLSCPCCFGTRIRKIGD